jgi:hypothetical protein
MVLLKKSAKVTEFIGIPCVWGLECIKYYVLSIKMEG